MDNQFNNYNSFENSDNQNRPVYSGYTTPYSNRNVQTNAQVVSNNSIGNQNRNSGNNKKKSHGWIVAVIIIGVCLTITVGALGGYALKTVMTGIESSISDSSNNSNSSSVPNKDNIQEPKTRADFFNYAVEDKDTEGLSTAEIAEKCCPSVVEIRTEIATYGGWFGQSVQSGAGSGVILTSDGYIVTNHHVIDGATKITVQVDDDHKYEAKLIGSDANADIALLKIDAEDLTPATVGDSDNMVVGEKTIVIGNPLGTLGDTVTDGIVSALDREVTVDGARMKLFQTNAAISPGNSGGGVFNAAGNLIGIVDAKSVGTDIEGIGFAIPVNVMTKVVREIMDYGYVKGYIDTGIEFLDINDYFTAMQYRVTTFGVYVYKVNSDLALSAGFQSGDRITKVAGKEVSTSAEIDKILEDYSVGDQVVFTVERSSSSSSLNLTLTLGEYVPSTLSNTPAK